MDLGLQGKRAIVTGASKGLGRAIAESLAAEGVAVAICARSKDGVGEAVEALAAHGVPVHGGTVDVADGDAYRAWIASAIESLGGLDVFVHNASGRTGKGDESYRHSLDIDLLGLVRAAEVAADALAESADGNLVSISSTAAVEQFLGAPNSYSALKAALIQYSAGLSQSLGPRGIRANTVSPGPIYFEGGSWETIREKMPQVYEQAVADHPAGAMGGPENIAAAVTFLASPRAKHITGVNLVVDGGYTKRVDF